MTPPPLAIRLFGSLRVAVRGEPMPRVRTRSVEWLLALLALRHGRSVNRSWLAGTLWPESSGSRALQNLRNDLVALRRALGPESGRIQSPTLNELKLDLDGAVVDVVQFDTAVQAGDDESLRRAVEVYTGPLLEECPAEWAFTERTARAEQVLAALEGLAERAAGRGDHGEAIPYLRRAEALDPLRDSLVQRLMVSLTAAGDPSAAIQVYREFRIRLEQLAAAPDGATTRLFQEIRAAARHPAAQRRLAPAPASGPVTGEPRTVPEPLPRPLTSLIGRDQELSQIRATLEQSRLVTLVGGGGVGKTRLALEVALRESAATPEGAAWVELGPLVDGALVLPSVAAAVGIRENGGAQDVDALTRRLVAQLAEDAPLLVLDNCEHVLDAAAATVQMLLQRCPGLRVLATSQQRLGLPGEVTWRVPSLPVPEPERWPAASEEAVALALRFAAVRLFVERAAAVHPEFRLASGAEAGAVGLICRRLDGLPLAIELAAARARVLTPQQIAARLDDRFSLLTRGARGSAPRHQTLRALIDWSYETLPEAEAALLRRLSVFAGGWTLEAAEAIGGGDQNPSSVLDLLDSLVDRSLVLVDEVAQGLRYRMLETVREYAREQLAASGEQGPIRRRHWEWYLQLAKRGWVAADLPEQREWLLRLEQELDNFRVALRACHEAAREGERTAAAAGMRLATALDWFWVCRGYLAEGLGALETALADGADLPAAARAPALAAAADVAGARGESARSEAFRQQSRDAHEAVLEATRGKGERKDLATILLSLLETCYWLGDLDAAWSYGLEARRLMEELGDPVGLARVFEVLPGIPLRRGDLRTARPILEERLAICRKLGTATLLVHALGGIGHLERDEGEYARARAYYQESLALRLELGDKWALAQSLEDLAVLAEKEGQAERAIRLLGAEAAFCETLGASPPTADGAMYQRAISEGRSVLGEAAFAAAWAEGRAMSLPQAFDYALQEPDAVLGERG